MFESFFFLSRVESSRQATRWALFVGDNCLEDISISQKMSTIFRLSRPRTSQFEEDTSSQDDVRSLVTTRVFRLEARKRSKF